MKTSKSKFYLIAGIFAIISAISALSSIAMITSGSLESSLITFFQLMYKSNSVDTSLIRTILNVVKIATIIQLVVSIAVSIICFIAMNKTSEQLKKLKALLITTIIISAFFTSLLTFIFLLIAYFQKETSPVENEQLNPVNNEEQIQANLGQEIKKLKDMLEHKIISKQEYETLIKNLFNSSDF